MIIISAAMRYWRQAMSQSAIWSAALWTLVFTLLLTLVMTTLGAGTIASAFYHPTSPFAAPLPAVSNPGNVMGGMAAMFILILLAGPFLTAGIYGLFGQAVAGNSITWSSFWRLGGRFYGRAWSMILFLFLWGVALTIVGVLLAALLHTVGIVIAALLAIGSWPLAIRMMGGLFVNVLTWSESFRGAWTGQGYGAIWGGGLVALLAYIILVGLALVLIKPLGIVGIVLYFLVLLFMDIAVPLWVFAVYRAVH